MLLLVGDPDDLTSTYVGWLAEQRGLPVSVLAERDFGVTWWANVAESPHRVVLEGDALPSGTTAVGAFVRLNPDPPLPEGWQLSGPAGDLFIQERRAAITEVLDALTVPVVNPASAGRSNGAKPFHFALLARQGLRIPPWTASNDPTAVRAFLATCPEGAVVKAASGLRSHVRLVDDEYLRRLEAGTTTSIVQRYVAGSEVRVHVVGDRVFGSAVEANVIDYRFDADEVQYSPITVPTDLAETCVAAAAADGLLLAGLDFRVDAAGMWWCLEMNPVPTFLPYEAATGHAIGDAVLDLIEGRPATQRESPLTALTAASAARLGDDQRAGTTPAI